MMEESKAQETCSVCSLPAEKKCGGCHQVTYCSVEHQKQDWSVHRSTCYPFEIKEDESRSPMCISGKYVIATRDLAPGTIILDEKVLYQKYVKSPSACITCGLDVDFVGVGSKSCGRCGWPVCSSECEKHPVHAEQECSILASGKKSSYRFDPIGQMNCIENTPALCRAKAVHLKNPKLWSEMMKILHWDKHEKPNPLRHYMVQNGQDMTWLHDAEELCRKHGFHYIVAEEHSGRPVTRMGTYVGKKASHFTHSCLPNCDWLISSGHPSFKIRIRAAVAISKGQRLTVSHIMCDMEHGLRGICGTMERQLAFMERYRFPCTCTLCSDPTEMGSYQSAILCPVCQKANRCHDSPPPKQMEDNNTNKEQADHQEEKANEESAAAAAAVETKVDEEPRFGYLLPQDPTNFKKKDPLWQCDLCQGVQKFSSFSKEYQRIYDAFMDEESNESLVKFCAALIKKYYEAVQNKTYAQVGYLHPNHWLLQKCGRFLCMIPVEYYGENYDYITSAYGKACEPFVLMKCQLDIWNMTIPGLSRQRATLQRTLCDRMKVTIMTYINEYGERVEKNRALAGKKPAQGMVFGDKNDLEKMWNTRVTLLELIEMLKESAQYFKTAPPERGHKESVIAQKILADLDGSERLLDQVQDFLMILVLENKKWGTN